MFTINKVVVSVLCIAFVGVFIQSCSQKKYEGPIMEKVIVQTDIVALNKYLEVPQTMSGYWAIFPMGRTADRSSVGPSDYELLAYFTDVPSSYIEMLCENMTAIENEVEGLTVENDMLKKLPIKDINNVEIIDEIAIVSGKVVDVKPLIKSLFSAGRVVIIGKSILFQANTY